MTDVKTPPNPTSMLGVRTMSVLPLLDYRAASPGETLRILREIAELLRETAELNRQTARMLQSQTSRRRPLASGPQNLEHRTWEGFVRSMQTLELEARRFDLKPTKQAICGLGADSPKTITRTMRRYGLRPDQWPPSTWINCARGPAKRRGARSAPARSGRWDTRARTRRT